MRWRIDTGYAVAHTSPIAANTTRRQETEMSKSYGELVLPTGTADKPTRAPIVLRDGRIVRFELEPSGAQRAIADDGGALLDFEWDELCDVIANVDKPRRLADDLESVLEWEADRIGAVSAGTIRRVIAELRSEA
jgi:hypothetical protein